MVAGFSPSRSLEKRMPTHRIPVYCANDRFVYGCHPVVEILEVVATVSADKVELSLLLDVGTS